MSSYAMRTTLAHTSPDQAVERVTAALADQGFGVLTTIDVQAVFKAKLDLDHRPYRILGACNPTLARDAIAADPLVGLLLPCNVVVQEVDGGCEVAIVDPHAMLSVADDSLQPLAEEARVRLQRVIAALG